MSTERTQVFFHQYANDFDAIYSNRGGFVNSIVNSLFRKSMKLRYLKSIEGCYPIEGKTVLDVGCGPGHYAITLAQRGAARVLGIDFADGMLKIAEEHARAAGVAGRCEFRQADFFTFRPPETFDYVILMGFMDYMPEPRKVVEKALSLTRSKAFFSFPVDGGLLAWQRKLRYRKRCELYMYTRGQLEKMFAGFPGIHARIEPIARDFFVTASVTAPSAQ
jgi:2-polyprenyl-3-methyl-5-hydroxy-6-metoxy-1,4-benzoquinol methylase